MNQWILIKKVFYNTKAFRPHLAGIFLLNLIATPIALIKPLPIKILIDTAFGSQSLPFFIRFFFPANFVFSFQGVVIIVTALIIIFAIVEYMHGVILWLLNILTGEKIVLNFRTLIFNHIQRLSLAYHDRKGTSDALYKIQYDSVAIRTLLINNLSPLLSSVITLLGMIAVMFMINWHFALITVSIIPPLFILTRRSSSRLLKDWQQVLNLESKSMSVVHEVLSSLRVVKAFGREDDERDRFTKKADEAVEGQVKVAKTGAFFYFIVGIIFSAATAIFIYLGAMYVKQGHMTLGELTLVIAYLSQIFGPLEKISKNFNDIQSSFASMDRIFSLLEKEKEVEEVINPINILKATGAIQFQNTSFCYEKEKMILADITFTVKPGSRVGIIGSTGAGKSTLINLLTRFYDPVDGKILMDEINIKSYKLSDYRNQFGIVLQEPVLFSSTIRENISYGLPGANFTEIVEAAKAANAHDFIMNCKNGYDTIVGERGMQLSGGERQRISIARAFIKDAPILILDEPTSSLDMKTESQILQAMERLMNGRTTFFVTHRHEALRTCDIILHLEKGKLIDKISSQSTDFIEQKRKAFDYFVK